MAKKSNIGGVVGSVFTVVAVIVVVYFGYRLLKPAAAQAATSPGGIYGNGGYDPYNPYSQPTTGNGGGLLSSLLNLLGLGKGSSSGRSGGGLSGGSSGAGGGSSSSKPGANTASYSNTSSPVADIYNSIVEGLYGNGQLQGSESNPDLGGYSLSTYEPDYSGDLSGYQIPYEDAGQQFDFGGGQPYTGGWSQQDFQDNGSSGYVDTTSYGGDFSIDDGD